jgi:hypothetical protein
MRNLLGRLARSLLVLPAMFAANFSSAIAFEPVKAFNFEPLVPTREATGTITEIDRFNFILTLDDGRSYQVFDNMIAVVDIGSVVTLKHLLDTDLTVLEMRDASAR